MSEKKSEPTGRVIDASVRGKASSASAGSRGPRPRGGALVEDTSVIGNVDGTVTPRPPDGVSEGATDPRERSEEDSSD